MSGNNGNWFYNIEKSAIVTFIGVVVLFAFSVGIVLIAPRHIDPTWTQPSSPYQVQMYEISDPNFYISSAPLRDNNLQTVYHLKKDFSLLAFNESENVRIVAPKELEKYITKEEDKKLKLTNRLLLLRKPEAPKEAQGFNALETAGLLREQLLNEWTKANPQWKKEDIPKPEFEIYELYQPEGEDAFALGHQDNILENWVDQNYTLIDPPKHPYHNNIGVIYVSNPVEYRISPYKFGKQEGYKYDPNGERIKNLAQLTSHPLGFKSRSELIFLGESLYKIEGCWYCHTDQTRTLVQDTVLNGAAAFPAPPSTPNEYIYQTVTFPGTKRNGPDISRTGVKRPSRDWHRGHFWSPKTASKGSIMPAFKHFFDNDPSGTAPNTIGIPNWQFEAIYQYLMTKGTRITPPTQAWWLGKDPINTLEIIEGRKKLP